MGDDKKTLISGNGGASPVRAIDERYEELKAARVAALNLMEDAIEARQRADALVDQLRAEVKARELAEASVRSAEKAHAFVLKLSDAVRLLADPGAVQQTAARVLCEHLGVEGGAYYLEIGEDGDSIDSMSGYWTTSPLDLPAGSRISELGEWFLDTYRARRSVVYRDVETDERFDEAARAAYGSLNVRAGIGVPLWKDDRLVALFGVTHSVPRDWTDGEIVLVDDVAERTWAAVERARAEQALRESEAQFRRAMSIETVGVLFFSLDGRIQNLNDAFARMSGFSREELQGDFDWSDLTPAEFSGVTGKAARELAETGETVPYEKQMIRKDGTRWWGLFAPTRISGEGKNSRCVEFVIDITDRKNAEAAVRRSETKYRTLFDSMDEGFCIIEVMFDEAGNPFDWKFCEVNPAFEKNMGLKDAEGRTMLQMVPSIEPKWFEIYGKIAVSGEPLRFVEHSAALDRWLDLYAFRVGGPNENKIAVLFTNVTQQKETEEELRRSSERMRLLIEGATDVSIFTTDRNGIINSWNPGSERIYGYTEDEIVGRDVAVLFTEENRKQRAHIREMEVATADGRAHDERWHLRKDGTTFYASGLTQPIGEGGSEGFVKIARDMTDRIRAEQAQRERELMQSLVTAQEAVRKQIARDLHDELGQQLTALRLKLDHVSSEAPEPLCERVQEVQEIAKSIDEGVDFLAWELRPAALDDLGLLPALERYVKEWSNYSGVKGNISASAAIERRFEPAVETALYRIVQEALNNVHKHAKARNAQVTIKLRRGKLLLIVDDDGNGFDPKDPSTRGRGIGLIGMKERVQMIGGSMEIESEIGHGTTLYVKAPMNSQREQQPS